MFYRKPHTKRQCPGSDEGWLRRAGRTIWRSICTLSTLAQAILSFYALYWLLTHLH